MVNPWTTGGVTLCSRRSLSVRLAAADVNGAVRQSGIAECRKRDQRVVQVRAGQVRAGQVRAEQVRAGQVRAGQVRAGQVRTHQGRSTQIRAVQVRARLQVIPRVGMNVTMNI